MGCFHLHVNYSHKMAKKRNFNTLTILYIHIPLKPIKILPKNVGYVREYPGTIIDPSMNEEEGLSALCRVKKDKRKDSFIDIYRLRDEII